VLRWLFALDATRHQLCGSMSHGMMHEAGTMQAFNAAAAAAQPMISAHHQGQQYAGSSSVSLPAHQPHHGHIVVDNVYPNMPGTFAA